MTRATTSEASSGQGKNVAVKLDGQEQIYFNPNSQVQLQQPLIDQLSQVSDGHPNLTRQAALDSSIQRKLKSDLERLKKLEAEVDSKVREAFKQQTASKPSKDDQKINSSAQLMEELSSIKQKIQSHRSKNSSRLSPDIMAARGAIASCLIQNQQQPLKCTEELNNFKKVVRNFENEFVVSMQ